MPLGRTLSRTCLLASKIKLGGVSASWSSTRQPGSRRGAGRTLAHIRERPLDVTLIQVPTGRLRPQPAVKYSGTAVIRALKYRGLL
jgi:hypothetical protein